MSDPYPPQEPVTPATYAPPEPYPAPQPVAYQMVPMVPMAPMLVQGPTFPKSKTTAILLAIFLGPWTFLYTYKRDSGLFWLHMVLGIFACWILWPLVAWIWAIIAACVRSNAFYERFPNA